jgi:hypothetical protein
MDLKFIRVCFDRKFEIWAVTWQHERERQAIPLLLYLQPTPFGTWMWSIFMSEHESSRLRCLEGCDKRKKRGRRESTATPPPTSRRTPKNLQLEFVLSQA